MRNICKLPEQSSHLLLLPLLSSTVMSFASHVCVVLLLCLLPPCVNAQRLTDFVTPQPLPKRSTLVVGFLGGLESWDNAHRGVRRVALDLRAAKSPRVFAETVENRHTKRALELIRRALDANRNGKLEPEECASARIILFGQSLGGAAAIRTANALHRWGVPVLLTVQVDSFGLGDALIPPNVSKAANFYQRGPLTIQGRSAIRAQDPQRTQILGNFLRSYPVWAYDPRSRADASRLLLTIGGGHVRMEADPELWAQVEQLILTSISNGNANHPAMLKVQQ